MKPGTLVRYKGNWNGASVDDHSQPGQPDYELVNGQMGIVGEVYIEDSLGGSYWVVMIPGGQRTPWHVTFLTGKHWTIVKEPDDE